MSSNNDIKLNIKKTRSKSKLNSRIKHVDADTSLSNRYNAKLEIPLQNDLLRRQQHLNLKQKELDFQEKKIKRIKDKIKANKSWNSQIELMAKELGEQAAAYNWMHEKSAHNCYLLGLAFTVTEIILSTLVGGGVMSTISDSLDYLWVKIICGVIVWAVAIITGIQENLNYSGQSIEHKKAACNFANLYHTTKEELSKYRKNRPKADTFIKSNHMLFDCLVSAGPEISDHVMKQYLAKAQGSGASIPSIVSNRVDEIEIKHDDSFSERGAPTPGSNQGHTDRNIFKNTLPGIGTVKKSPSVGWDNTKNNFKFSNPIKKEKKIIADAIIIDMNNTMDSDADSYTEDISSESESDSCEETTFDFEKLRFELDRMKK